MSGEKKRWSDDKLDAEILNFLKNNGYISPEKVAGHYTIFKGIKKPDIILGVYRVKDRLIQLEKNGKVKSTKTQKYYLIVENKKDVYEGEIR